MSQTVNQEGIRALLDEAVEELNQQLRKAQRLEKTPETVLSGEGGRLDSLGLLNLLVFTEQRIESRYGVSVMLADDEALAREPSPFASLGSLAEHARQAVEKKLNGH